MSKVYCHTSYTERNIHDDICVFTKGNWYNVLEFRIKGTYSYYKILCDYKNIQNIWNIYRIGDSTKGFKDVFYTQDEYREIQLNKLLNE